MTTTSLLSSWSPYLAGDAAVLNRWITENADVTATWAALRVDSPAEVVGSTCLF